MIMILDCKWFDFYHIKIALSSKKHKMLLFSLSRLLPVVDNMLGSLWMDCGKRVHRVDRCDCLLDRVVEINEINTSYSSLRCDFSVDFSIPSVRITIPSAVCLARDRLFTMPRSERELFWLQELLPEP